MTLLEMVREYQGLLEKKNSLAEQTKENNAAIEEAKAMISQQMVDDDCPRISTGGYCFSLTAKTAYTKRSDAELAQNGVDFLGTLREEGLGSIIVEKVDSRTLQSTINAYTGTVVSFTLEKVKNSGGIAYSKVQVKKSGFLPKATAEAVKALHRELKAQYKNTAVTSEDYTAPANTSLDINPDDDDLPFN